MNPNDITLLYKHELYDATGMEFMEAELQPKKKKMNLTRFFQHSQIIEFMFRFFFNDLIRRTSNEQSSKPSQLS